MKKMLLLLISLSLFAFGSQALAADGQAIFKSKGCAACHAKGGTIKMGPTPKVAGLSKERIVQSLNTYQAGGKVGPGSRMMSSNKGVKSLTADEINVIADFLAQ